MSETAKIISPIDGSVYAERPIATDVKAAVSAARAAQAEWRRVPVAERGRTILAFLDALLAMNDEIMKAAELVDPDHTMSAGELHDALSPTAWSTKYAVEQERQRLLTFSKNNLFMADFVDDGRPDATAVRRASERMRRSTDRPVVMSVGSLTRRKVGSSVANSMSSAITDAPVSRLNRVDLPAFV